MVYEIGKVCIEKYACFIEINEEFVEGLKDLDQFSHLFVLWWISRRDTSDDRTKLVTTPPRLKEQIKTGVFSCRSPSRPNPIGLTKVKLEKIEDSRIYIDRIDAIDGTPILDIKPYLPGDSINKEDLKVPGWFNHLKKKQTG